MKKTPLMLIIMDGLGKGKHDKGDAVYLAKTPTLDMFAKNYPSIEMITFGEKVGLPKKQMGNSEVGHTNLGAGRIVRQGLTKINYAIETKEIFNNVVIKKAIKYAREHSSNLQLLGLLSDGGVHSTMEHLYPILEMANQAGVNVFIHGFLDGRDVPPTSAKKYVKELLLKIKGKATLASMVGRYYAMDRDKRWERVESAFNTITQGKGEIFEDPLTYIQNQYDNGITDEFIQPAIHKGKQGLIRDNDAVFFINFRPDRARQLSHLFIGSNAFEYSETKKLKNIYFSTMMKYDGINCDMAFPPEKIVNGLGEWLEKKGYSQLRIAETEKYPHVTFFFDGGETIAWQNSKKILVPSPKVATYDLKPEMSAYEVTSELLKVVDKFDVVILNFANPDMVGHTGKIPAVIKAVETIDAMIKKIYDKVVLELNGQMLVTADHGNADEMLDKKNNPITKHSTNPVPIYLISKSFDFKPEFKTSLKAKLADIAPTLLTILDEKIPNEMTGSILIKQK